MSPGRECSRTVHRAGGAEAAPVDVIVVGAGIAGLYAIHRLRGMGFRVHCFERGTDVGGTWYWNRYPGARCDVESLDYSYSFDLDLEREWKWTEKYATQPEILRYLRHVAERFDLRRDITLDTEVTSAVLDEERLLWTVTLSTGEHLQTQHLVLATGPLSVANAPSFPGQESFGGRILHTGRWPHEQVDFAGRRVAVIGTGSSGIQLIPQIAAAAEHLDVLQRTPNFSIPARNFRWEREDLAEAMSQYRERRERSWVSAGGTPYPAPALATFDVDPDERRDIFELSWRVGGARFARTFTDQMSDLTANAESVAFVHDKIRQIVSDPEVADLLLPLDHPLGAKRICVDTGYYETYNRPNVTLHDLRHDPIRRIEPSGVRLSSELLPVDDVVFATGFDAMTGAVLGIDPVGRAGRRLREEWADGPVTLLGLAVPGFPNLFVINGPGSPSVLVNMVLTSQQQVDWISSALDAARSGGFAGMEATAGAAAAWGDSCASISTGSLFLQANSWYVGANIPGKPRVLLPYVGGLPRYQAECYGVAESGYQGFDLIPARSPVRGSGRWRPARSGADARARGERGRHRPVAVHEPEIGVEAGPAPVDGVVRQSAEHLAHDDSELLASQVRADASMDAETE
jgi:cyclohexanone monooxygenase